MDRFGDKVEFLTVYVREAHACDVWPLGRAVSIPKHKTLEDRVAAAKKFVEENAYRPRLVIDCMEDDFDQKYAAWPERAYIIEQNKVVYICDMNDEGGIEWEEGVEDWLVTRYGGDREFVAGDQSESSSSSS